MVFLLILVLVTTTPAFGLSFGEADGLQAIQQLAQDGKHDEVRARGTELLADLERRHGPDSAEVADVLHLLVRSSWRGGRRNDAEARAWAERAVSIRQEVNGGDAVETARALQEQAAVMMSSDDPASAVPVLEAAIAIFEKTLESDDVEIARALADLANMHGMQGNLARAAALQERVLEIHEVRFGPESSQVAGSLQNFGNTRFRLGDLGGAKQSYERSIRIRESLFGKRHPSLTGVLTAYGFLLWQMGDLSQARSSLEWSIAISEETVGPDSVPVADALSNLGVLLMEIDLPAARKALERSLRIREAKQGTRHPDVAISLHNLGVIARRQQDYDVAAGYYRRALAITEDKLGRDHPDVATNLINLANLLTLAGTYDQARPRYARALRILKSRLGPSHPQVVSALDPLAGLALLEGRLDDSVGFARRATRIQNRHIAEVVGALPERQALLLVDARDRPEGVLFAGLLQARGAQKRPWLEACWDWSLQRRGLVLDELARRSAGSPLHLPPEHRRARQRVDESRRRLAKLWIEGLGSGDPDAYRSALAEARKEKEDAEAALARLAPKDERITKIELEAVRVRLPANSVLIEVVRTVVGPPTRDDRKRRDVALALHASGRMDHVDLGPSEDLDRLAVEWRQALAASWNGLTSGRVDDGSMHQLQQVALRLRRAVWDPLLPLVHGARSIYLVPEGAYHQIDLAALPTSSRGFLIETAPPIYLLDTGRDLMRPATESVPGSAGGRGVLALGDPDFESTGGEDGDRDLLRSPADACHALAERNWSRLPGSGLEARRVGRLLGESDDVLVLTGSEASESRFRRAAPGRRILHVATHGFFLQDECGSADGTAMRLAGDGLNPLLLSGLVLAGANRSSGVPGGEDDGIVTAEELAALDLARTDLVVLSACDTGLGAVQSGEGVLGLRRALRIAGADGIVMSLWPVPDVQAVRWMSLFYNNLQEGVNVQAAARQATFDSLQALRYIGRPVHPYLFSGFVAVGPS